MAPFELFGRNFCLATLQHWLCVVVLLRIENTCRPARYGRESSLQGGQQAGLLAVPARPAVKRSSAVLPGGRNSGQKAQKGPQKKKFLAEFWLILPKTGRKGAAENFQNKFLIFSCWPNFLDVLAGNFFGTWQHCTQLGFAVPARPAGILSSQEHHHTQLLPAASE